jgi:hypothetical protein
MSILDGLNERIARHRNRDFLKAAMAASALAMPVNRMHALDRRITSDAEPSALKTLHTPRVGS